MDDQNPWKTLNSSLVYQNPWIRIREDRVIRPDGNEGIYGVVQAHPATGVVAINDSGEIFLVGQYRYPTEEYSWEIIEGGCAVGETPLEAAKRELREEAGLIASDWSPLGDEIHLSNCFSNERAHLFLARGLSEVDKQPDATEVLEIRRLPFSEALALVDGGELRDAMSIIGILRAARSGKINV